MGKEARRSNIYAGRILIGRTRRLRWREPDDWTKPPQSLRLCPLPTKVPFVPVPSSPHLAATRADRLFAEAGEARFCHPFLPPHMLLGEAKVPATGDYVAADTHAKAAATLGPKAADNYVWWGRVLLALRRPADAAEKFALAANNAPAWGRARLEWAEALWLVGIALASVRRCSA